MTPRIAASVCLSALALALLSTPALAQSLDQKIEVMGWTATGNEIISRVTIGSEGIDNLGDPIQWSYTVIEVTSARTGKILSRYQTGTPEGTIQPGWRDAKSNAEGQKRLAALGLLPSQPSPISPDGGEVVLPFVGRYPEEMKTLDAKCIGCNVCTTVLQLQIVHRDHRKVYKLPSNQRKGTPYPPDEEEAGCPTLGVRIWWHPQAERFAVVYSEQQSADGGQFDRLRVYDPSTDAAAWKATDIPAAAAQSDHQQRLSAMATQYRDMMASSTDDADRAILMARLGDISRRLGRPDDARGYYEGALGIDANNTRAIIGKAHIAHQSGDVRKAARIIRKAETLDRKHSIHSADLGLYHLLTGDAGRAERFFQKASDSGLTFDAQLDIVRQLLDADLRVGLDRLDALLDDTPETPDKKLAAELHRLTKTLIEESIRLGQLDTAARHVSRLDKTHLETQTFALLIAALRSTDPDRLAIIIDRSGALIQEHPQLCGLYRTRALALAQARQTQDALTHISAAAACNPDDVDAQLDLANMLSGAGKPDKAMQAYELFLEKAPERPGDSTRRDQRRAVKKTLQRLGSKGIVLLRWECAQASTTRTCKGLVHNNATTPSGPVDIELTAYSGGARPTNQGLGRARLTPLAPGATADFQVSLELPSSAASLKLIVGSNLEERTLNAVSPPL